MLTLSAALLSAQASAAEPDDETRARGHFEVGLGLYRLGDYKGALKEFAAGYVLGKKPGFLLNIAQSYRQLGDPVKARDTYQQFLAEASPEDSHRAQVKQTVGELDQEIRLHPPKPVEPEPSTAPEPPPKPTKVEEETPPVSHQEITVVTPPPHRGNRGLRVTGLVLGGIGVIGLAGGLAAGLLASNAAGELNSLDQMHKTYDPDLYRTYQLDRTAEYASLGVGAAALATGVILYLVGRR